MLKPCQTFVVRVDCKYCKHCMLTTIEVHTCNAVNLSKYLPPPLKFNHGARALCTGPGPTFKKLHIEVMWCHYVT